MLDQTITLETCFQIEKAEGNEAAWEQLVAFAQHYKDSSQDSGRDAAALREDAGRRAALLVDDIMLTHFRNEVEQQGIPEGESRADVLKREGYYQRVSEVTKKINEYIPHQIS